MDARPAELQKHPPQQCLKKTRGWLIRHINAARATQGLRELPKEWGRTLANGRAETRHVNAVTRTEKEASGALFHHKHDLAPTQEQLTAMTLCGWTTDQRVHADVLDAVEAGVAVGLYLPSGARGTELKTMHLQSLGYEPIPYNRSGIIF